MNKDPLLAALNDARQRREQADREIRVLLAYARELTKPRPYRLVDLAEAAGMSISGVRTAYTDNDSRHAAQALMTNSSDDCPGHQYLTAAVNALLGSARDE